MGWTGWKYASSSLIFVVVLFSASTSAIDSLWGLLYVNGQEEGQMGRGMGC